MNETSKASKGETRRVGPPTLTQRTRTCAPETAHGGSVLAAIDPGVVLSRINRPSGPVTLEAGAGLLIMARINRLARTAERHGPDGARRALCLGPDYLLVVDAGERAVLPGHEHQDLLLIRVTPQAAQEIADISNLTTWTGRPIADRLLSDIVERLFDAGPGARSISLLRTLLLELASLTPATPAQATGGLTLRQLQRLRDHVEGRLHEPLRNLELARLVELSPFHFARAFKTSMGAAPGVWIRLRRLTVAQKLLADAGRPVIEVAAADGYESPSRFAHAFRGMTGLSPSEWRRAAQVSSA